MAILGGQTQDDQDQQNQGGQQPGVQTATGNTSGGGGGYVGGGTGQGATTTAAPGQASPAGSSSGSYTNLQSYLNANQGSGGDMGKAIEGSVDTAGKDADQKIGSYTSDVTGDVANGSKNINVDQGVLGQIKSGTANLDPSVMNEIQGGVYQGKYNGPGSTPGGAKDLGAYKGPTSVDASYKGPQSLGGLTGQSATDQGNAYKAVSNVVGQAQQAGNGQSGVASLLQNVYGAPGGNPYTRGQNTLDAFLTTGTAGGQQALAQTQKDWGGEQDKLTQADTGLSSAISGAQKTAAGTQKTYADAIHGGQVASQGVQKQYGDAIKGALAQANKYQAPAAQPAPALAQPAQTPLPAQNAVAANDSNARDPVTGRRLAHR
jgi:hypothetical protein